MPTQILKAGQKPTPQLSLTGRGLTLLCADLLEPNPCLTLPWGHAAHAARCTGTHLIWGPLQAEGCWESVAQGAHGKRLRMRL